MDTPRYLIMSFLDAEAAQAAVNEKAGKGYSLRDTFRTGEYMIVVVMELKTE